MIDRDGVAAEMARSAVGLLGEACGMIQNDLPGGRGLALVGIGEALCSLALSAERIADVLCNPVVTIPRKVRIGVKLPDVVNAPIVECATPSCREAGDLVARVERWMQEGHGEETEEAAELLTVAAAEIRHMRESAESGKVAGAIEDVQCPRCDAGLTLKRGRVPKHLDLGTGEWCTTGDTRWSDE